MRDRSALATRTQVLRAAAAEFQDRGYSAPTIVEIARQAGVSVNTVYALFGSKPKLLATLIEQAANNDSARDALSAALSAASGDAVIRGLGRALRRNNERWSWIIAVGLNNARGDPQIEQASSAGLRGYEARLAAAVDRIAALGELATPGRADAIDQLWFFFGPAAWRTLRERCWSWPRAEMFLTARACHAVVR